MGKILALTLRMFLLTNPSIVVTVFHVGMWCSKSTIVSKAFPRKAIQTFSIARQIINLTSNETKTDLVIFHFHKI